MGKFDGVDIADAAKEDFESDSDGKETAEKDLEGVIDFLKEVLGKDVEDVSVSMSLTDSPAVLRQGQFGMSPTMQRYMQAQSVGAESNPMLGEMNSVTLLLNPGHKVVTSLKTFVDQDDPRKETWGR